MMRLMLSLPIECSPVRSMLQYGPAELGEDRSALCNLNGCNYLNGIRLAARYNAYLQIPKH